MSANQSTWQQMLFLQTTDFGEDREETTWLACGVQQLLCVSCID
jgi:hypothetical protein